MYKLTRSRHDELQKEKGVNYILEIRKKGKALIYFGANHSHDIKNPQNPKLKKAWQEFVADKKLKNKIVFIEGTHPRPLRRNEKEAIESGAEGGLITLLAHRAGIPTFSPEPPKKEILKKLRKKFRSEEIQYYVFAGLVDQWNRMRPRPDFKKWMEAIMPKQEKLWNFRNFTLKRLLAFHKRMFGRFYKEKRGFFNGITNPNRNYSVINKIALTSSDLRDDVFIREIKRFWDEGKSIFAPFGSSHVILEEPILRRILK